MTYEPSIYFNGCHLSMGFVLIFWFHVFCFVFLCLFLILSLCRLISTCTCFADTFSWCIMPQFPLPISFPYRNGHGHVHGRCWVLSTHSAATSIDDVVGVTERVHCLAPFSSLRRYMTSSSAYVQLRPVIFFVANPSGTINRPHFQTIPMTGVWLSPRGHLIPVDF